MKPSIGRIVHYVSHGTPPGPDGFQAFESKCRAAVITEVHDDPRISVGLCVLNPTGQFFNQAVPHDELPPAGKIVAGERTAGRAGTWHWPERAD